MPGELEKGQWYSYCWDRSSGYRQTISKEGRVINVVSISVEEAQKGYAQQCDAAQAAGDTSFIDAQAKEEQEAIETLKRMGEDNDPA